MSESVRRRRYRYDRVLIGTDRVLTPQFDDAVVFLTGAQLEMLRNVTQYLNRLETYVSEYNPGYYIAPTAEDYDSILEIVADLEEALMGNPNTIFGYKDILFLGQQPVKDGDGDVTLFGSSPPEGQVWRIEGVEARNEDTACTRIRFQAHYPLGNMIFWEKDGPAADELVRWDGLVTLPEDGRIDAIFEGCLDLDQLRFNVQGYKMDVS